MSDRRQLPPRRPVLRQRVKIAGQNLYLDIGFTDIHVRDPREIFIVVQKTGGELRALMDVTARMISVGLQHGVPLSRYIDLLVGTRFNPAGPVVGDERIKFCSSPLDYVARHLGAYYAGRQDLAHV